MSPSPSLLVALGLVLLVARMPVPARAGETWPGWRGPRGDGKVPEERPPLKWDAATGVLWTSPSQGGDIPRRRWTGSGFFLASADEVSETQSVLAYDRETGKQLWAKVLFTGGLDAKAHKRNTQASCSVASDGEKVFALFMNAGAIHLCALSPDGAELWRKELGKFKSHWGYSASPILHGGSILVAADHADGGFVTAVARATGEIVWTQPRPKLPNYPPPIVARVAGKDQVLLAGCNLFSSYDPASGKLLWSATATTEECVGSVVVDGGLAFASGGYPKSETAAVRADGSGEIVWRNTTRIYVPSMLAHEGHLYAVNDSGMAFCWEAATGKEKWKERLGGVFNASPVLAGNHLFVAREDGATFVIKPDPSRLIVVSENKLGSEVFATPSFAGNRVYLRVAEMIDGKRQEFLYCVGEKD
ncbi:MAG: PQQ-like beta-propeller repeat protein [Verrucomicrobiota bacterium]|nr:PQQ-like beta-propeller repeat protein [Verrucomicrobiota bacterium]